VRPNRNNFRAAELNSFGCPYAINVDGKRRQRSKLERRRIVEETLKPGASVVLRRITDHSINRIEELLPWNLIPATAEAA